MRLILVRDVSVNECPWLERPFKKGEVVFFYDRPTYGCISEKGVAVTEVENKTPFFELPMSALAEDRDLSDVNNWNTPGTRMFYRAIHTLSDDQLRDWIAELEKDPHLEDEIQSIRDELKIREQRRRKTK